MKVLVANVKGKQVNQRAHHAFAAKLHSAKRASGITPAQKIDF
jgi:hypothetical protein